MPKPPEWLDADIQECYPACKGEIKAIQRAIVQKRGVQIAYMTISNHMDALGLERPRANSKKVSTQEDMIPDDVVQIDATDTPAEVHYDAVVEFDALPDGYAKEIQPMRPYSDAEEFALNESMRLFGFVGAIVRDQYGRILDGHHRQRVARLRGLGVPHTITHVRDDAHALAVATSLNAVRRQYPRKEREQIALAMRDQGFSYRVIAAALGVSKDTVQRDIFGGFKIIPAPEPEAPPVSSETPAPVMEKPPTVPQGTRKDPPHIKGRDGKNYPGQRNTKAPHASLDDRQVARMVDDLMRHAWMWSERHWQAFKLVVQNIDTTRQQGNHPLKEGRSSPEDNAR